MADIILKSEQGEEITLNAQPQVEITLGAGLTGPAGAPGAPGAAGVGIPMGGSTGQAVVKNSNADYDLGFATIPTTAELDGLEERIEDIEDVVDVPTSLTDLDATMTDLVSHIPSTLGTGSNQNYRAPTDGEVRGVLKGLRQIVKEAGKPGPDIDLTDATATLTPYGFTVTQGYDSTNNRPYVLAQSEYTFNPTGGLYRAWGNYFFDMSRTPSLFIQAPHPQTDGNSEFIALRTWQQTPGAVYMMSSVNRKARDYMVTELSTVAVGGTFTLTFRSQTTAPIAYNASPATVQAALEALSSIGTGNVICTGDNVNTSLHCFANLNPSLYNSGSPTDTITGDGTLLTSGTLSVDHDADVAHNYNSIFNKLTQDFATEGYAQLQLHGFSDVSSGIPRVFNAILSRGSSNNSKLIEVVRNALEANGFDVGTKDSFATQGLYVTGTPTGGTITLRYNGVDTAAIAYSTNQTTFASNVRTALEAHPNIGTGNISVTQSTNANTGVSQALVLTFKAALYHQGLTAITVSNNSLTGGTSPTASGLTAEGTALTAQSNTQGDIAEMNGTVFMHLEMSDTVRSNATLSARIVGALGNLNLPQLSAAAMPVLAESGHTSSQAPLVNGSGATIGTSPVAARADHRHPATVDTPNTDDIIQREANGWYAHTPDEVGATMTNVLHTTGAETATGVKTLRDGVVAGPTTDTLGTALAVVRNGVQVGRIDNNSNGLRVQAQTGSLQLRGTGNTGILVDASGNADFAANITAVGIYSNVSTTNTFAETLAVYRNSVKRGSINNFTNGMRVQATSNLLYLHGVNEKGMNIGADGQIVTEASITWFTRSITGARTLDATDNVIFANTAGGGFTVTLPTAVGIAGREYTVIKTSASNTLTFATTSAQTINGAVPGSVTTIGSTTFISDGANWFIK